MLALYRPDKPGSRRGEALKAKRKGEMRRKIAAALKRAASGARAIASSRESSKQDIPPAGYLERGWVIANHKLVSFHAAFISSVLSLPVVEMHRAALDPDVNMKFKVLKFMFLSPETFISLAILYLSWHIAIAIHEIGHFLTAARLTALNKDSQDKADAELAKPLGQRLGWYANMFLLTPWGKFYGVKKEGGNYAPDAPYNLAVSASAPKWSGALAAIFLPISGIFLTAGLILTSKAGGSDLGEVLIVIGRFFLAPGIVGLLDRLLADPGKLREFRTRERLAAERAAAGAKAASKESWLARVPQLKQKFLTSRIQSVTLADGTEVTAPWQFRNCAMGGRHTEKEYPESNISMQESMFMPLSAKTYEDAQEMTVKLQYRLKEVIESAPGAKVMGIGLEGGLAPYIDKDPQDQVPEQRMWRLMKQTILDCGYVPGVDVAIALDPAASELENAYRQETDQPDSVGMYRFWRDKGRVDMSRDQLLELYVQAMEKDNVPILSMEDPYGELDHTGWKQMMNGNPQVGIEGLKDKIFIIGDDLVTTKDETIERCAKNGEINAALIKANQIGTLSETVLAMLTALGYGAELVISHRSKSPNDPFEAEIATAMNAMGLKAGGGANTERLQKYGRVMEILALAAAGRRELTDDERKNVETDMKDLVKTLTGQEDAQLVPGAAQMEIEKLMLRMLAIETVNGTEEATNAGIPTAAATLFLGHTGIIRYKGSTPLGTSAGIDEAVHYVDSIVMPGELTRKYPDLFAEAGDGTYRFGKRVEESAVKAKNDPALAEAWRAAQRYDGKGCMEAVKHIETVLAKAFTGKRLSDLGTLLEVDQKLLALEKEEAVKAGRLSESSSREDQIAAMQRKAVIGMNAILSMSLALGRSVAAKEGKELWQLIRDMASDTMAKFTAAVGQGDVESLKKLKYDELQAKFREAAGKVIAEGKEVHKLLREQLPVYSA
jgi:enolase